MYNDILAAGLSLNRTSLAVRISLCVILGPVYTDAASCHRDVMPVIYSPVSTDLTIYCSVLSSHGPVSTDISMCCIYLPAILSLISTDAVALRDLLLTSCPSPTLGLTCSITIRYPDTIRQYNHPIID